MFVERRLKPTWDWILTVMDATEAQLRFGASLTDSTDSAHPLHPSNSTPATTSTSSKYHDQFPNTFEFLIFCFFSFYSSNQICVTFLFRLLMFVHVLLTQIFALIF